MSAETHVTTVRIPEDMAVEVELFSRVLGISRSDLIRRAIAGFLTARKSEVEFRQRLARRIEDDRRILDRLAWGGSERDMPTIRVTGVEAVSESTDPNEMRDPHLRYLANIIWTTSREDEGTISATGAQHIARAILNSDWVRYELKEAWYWGYTAGDQDARAVQKTWPEPTPNPYKYES